MLCGLKKRTQTSSGKAFQTEVRFIMFQHKDSSENYISRIVGLPREKVQVGGVYVLIK